MNEPRAARDYAEREVQAAYSVLIELGQILHPFADEFVIVGGSVPWLLLDEAAPPHLGSLDVDIGLDPEAMGEGRYATLVETLEKAGYQRDLRELKPFQMLREVPVDEREPIPVVIDLLAPKGKKLKGSRPPKVPGLRVQQIDGCGIAIAHHHSKELSGRMPDGRHNSVEIPVASIAALLVMKGYALIGRDKMKDAYDIYYSIRNYPGGPGKLGEECQELLNDPVAKEGFEHIKRKFYSRDSFGPETVRGFLDEAPPQFTDLDPEQVQTDAYGQVSAFLKSLGILD